MMFAYSEDGQHFLGFRTNAGFMAALSCVKALLGQTNDP